MDYLASHPDSFAMYFDGNADFERYVQTMGRSGTWGDELTLKVHRVYMALPTLSRVSERRERRCLVFNRS